MNTVAIFVVRFVSSFFRAGGLRGCRYSITCSEYSALAYRDFGFLKASFLTLKRLLSCHPWKKD